MPPCVAATEPNSYVRHRGLRQRHGMVPGGAGDDDPVARAPRSRRRRFLRVGARAPGPPAPLGHRHRRQSAADAGSRRATWPSCSTARSTTSARCATSFGSRLDLSLGRRHRDDSRRMARMGRAGRGASARHVRVRALGREDRHVLRGARPPRREAAALRVGRRHARVRFGAEGGARASRRAQRDRSGRAQALSRVPVHSGTALRVPRGAQAAACAHDQALRAHADHRTLLAAGLRGQAVACRTQRPRTRWTASCSHRSNRCWSPTCRSAHS